MNLVTTKTFELAVYVKGNPDSPKLALVLPGKLDTKDYPHMRSHTSYLADKGFLALSFDPPGTWGSSGDIKLYTMSNYLQAIHELIEHFGNRPTFVLGHSRGGSMAMLAGTSNPHVTHFGSIMSFYSFAPKIHGEYPDEDWKRKGFRLSERDIPHSKEKKLFKVPYSFLEDQIQYDMLDNIKHSTRPKMFVLGKQDSMVKPEIVKTAFEASSEPKMLYTLDSDHDYRRNDKLIQQINTYVDDFLARY